MPGLANDLNISESGYVTHDGAGVFHGRTFQAGTGITLTNADGISGNTTIASTASLTDLHTARFIVASSTAGTGANYTSITSAIAAAVGTGVNSTIVMQPGTYTENFTLPANINLCAYDCDAFTPNVTIVGTITCTTAGTRSISGIRLQTNSAALLAVTGSAATIVKLNMCYLNCTNNTGVTFSTSNVSALIQMMDCTGDIGTTGISLFTHTSTGTLNIITSNFGNSGLATTASTISAGSFGSYYSTFQNTFTSSGTGGLGIYHSLFNNAAINTVCLTIGGSGTNTLQHCDFFSVTASALSIGGTATVDHCQVSSSNTNAITGAGTINQSFIDFTSSSSTINTSTQVANPVAKIYSPSGITFDNSNTLSIFSQGTFSPTIRGSSTAGTIGAYGVQTGRYQKIGRLVTVTIVVSWTTIGTATGAVQCNNLPFTVINDSVACTAPSFVVSGGGVTLTTAASAVPFAQPNINAVTVNINYYLGATGANNATTITASNGFSTQLIYETV